MGRRDSRRKKEKQVKLANRRRHQSARAEAAETQRLRDEFRRRGLEILEFEITYDPIPDPLIDALPETDRAEFKRVGTELFLDPVPQREPIERLLARRPHIPALWNFLAVSVNAAGDRDRAAQLAEETYHRFPTYLFGVSHWVMTLLAQGRMEEATQVLGGRLGLAAWWPERRLYHASEFAMFNAMLGHYFLATGELKRSGQQLKLLRDSVPDHPAVEALEEAIVLDALRLLAEEYRDAAAPLAATTPDSSASRLRDAAGIL